MTVRSLNGQTDTKPAWLKMARWTEMVVFEASISFKEASNGNSWVECFGERIVLAGPNQIRNDATAGATGWDVPSQIRRCLAAGKQRRYTFPATRRTRRKAGISFACSNGVNEPTRETRAHRSQA